MHSIHLSLYSLCLGLIWIVLLLVGTLAALELYNSIFPPFVTSVSHRVIMGLYRSAILAAVIFSLIVILRHLTGGDTNAQ